LDGAYASKSDAIPLQAHAEGVRAKSLTLGGHFQTNESQQFALTLSRLQFSDGNRHSEAEVSWSEGWISEPHYKLGTQLTLSTMRNSRGDVSYFNPKKELSLGLDVINEGSLWRADQRSLRHRLILGAGFYEQQGQKREAIFGAKYEHQWDFSFNRSLLYGIEYQRHPYDGVNDERTGVFLSLDWRF